MTNIIRRSSGKNILLIVLISLTLSSAYTLRVLPDTSSYHSVKETVLTQKGDVSKSYNQGHISIDSVGRCFEELLINTLIPHWYGRPWDFNGHTPTPDSGSVACGYFVSTTLLHMGVKLNRYRLAQQSALNEVKSLAITSELIQHYRYKTNLAEQLSKELSDGLYIVGLDFHVGYLLVKEDKHYFIHSTYLPPAKVVIEETAYSEAWHASDNYYIAPVSQNPLLMKKWLKGTPLNIRTK